MRPLTGPYHTKLARSAAWPPEAGRLTGCERGGTGTTDASIGDSSNPRRHGTAVKPLTLSVFFVSPTLAVSGRDRASAD
jgi:hypothetical protein